MNASPEKSQNDGNRDNHPVRSEYRILDASSIGILISRVSDDEILYANQTVATLLGLADVEQIIGKPRPNFYWDANEYQILQEQFRVQGVVTNHELRARHANGSPVWILLSVRHFDFHGEQALISEIVDITERKQMEEALRKNQSLYQSLVEVSPMSMCRKDLEGRFTFANQRFLDLSHIALSDLVGKLDSDLHPSELADKYRRDDLAIMESGQVQELIEERAIHEGGTAYVQTIKAPIYDEAGKISGIQISFWDITDRKQAEEAIQASEERFRRFSEATNEGLVFHEQGKIIDINPAALAMFGLPDSAGIIGKSLLQFIVPEAHELVLKQMQLETVLPYEVQCLRQDNTIFQVETSTRTYKIAERTIRATSIRDITARKEAEKALQESEERFRRLTEATVEGLVFHEQGKIVDVNPAAVAIFGLANVEDFIGRNLLEFIVPEFHPQVLQQMQLESVLPYEIQGIRKDGSIIPVETSTRVYKVGEHTIRASSIRDITERKRAGQALQESQRLLQLVMDNIPQAVFWKDKDLTYLGTNQAFAEDAGFNSPQALVGKTDFDMPWKEQAELYRADDQRILELGEAKLNYEEPQTGPTGEITWLRTSKIPMRDANGKIFAVLGMYEDITEWKRLQQQVQEAFERRGYQVQISTEISQEVAAATELSDLFTRVVTLTKERLGYYHTQLLRYDAAQDAVVLINGYGETGQKMLADGHRMPMGAGLIGTAAASGETVLRPALADDPDWHPNPLLSETQGEIAVPIKWQNTVLGVLDVQSNRAGALGEEDRILLEGLCGQIAIAIHSAELVEAVRQNEADLKEALRIARLGNWEYDFERDLFQFTDAFYSIFRTTAEKVGGYEISSADYAKNFVHPDDALLVGAEIQRVLDSKDRFFTTNMEHRIIFSDGEIGYIAVNINVERDENGKITRWYGANQDITERKLAETALRESELRYQQILDAITDMILVKGEKSSIVWANKAFREYYGMTNEQLRDMIDAPIVEPDYTLQYIKDDAYVFETGEILQIPEEPVMRYDGAVRQFETSKAPIRDLHDKVVMTVGVSRDITERKKEQDAKAKLLESVRESELRYQQILDAITDMILVKGPKSSIIWANKAFREYYGMTNEQLRDMIDAPQVEPDYTLQYIRDDAQVFESGEVLVIPEEPVTRYDGIVRPFETFKAPIRDLNGNVVMTVGVSRDITERLKDKQAMTERLEEVNRLYQAMSHEGWKVYRETADLPEGFIYDQTGLRPVETEVLADELYVDIPMKVLGGEVVGSLAIAHDEQHPTSPEDFAFFQQVADQIALALESARLFEQTQSALAQSGRLFEASRRLAQVSDLQELVKTAVEIFNIPVLNGAELDLFGYDANGELESLTVVANWWNGTGTAPGVVGSRFTKGMFSAVKLFLTSTPVFISDALNSERVDEAMLRIIKTFNIRAATFLPLFLGSHQIGVLVMHAEEPHIFTEEETRLFSGLAPLFATVLENRRQFERAQQQAERESTLNAINQKIQGATTVEAVLQIAARELGHALGAPLTIAQLSMKDRK